MFGAARRARPSWVEPPGCWSCCAPCRSPRPRPTSTPGSSLPSWRIASGARRAGRGWPTCHDRSSGVRCGRQGTLMVTVVTVALIGGAFVFAASAIIAPPAPQTGGGNVSARGDADGSADRDHAQRRAHGSSDIRTSPTARRVLLCPRPSRSWQPSRRSSQTRPRRRPTASPAPTVTTSPVTVAPTASPTEVATPSVRPPVLRP